MIWWRPLGNRSIGSRKFRFEPSTQAKKQIAQRTKYHMVKGAPTRPPGTFEKKTENRRLRQSRRPTAPLEVTASGRKDCSRCSTHPPQYHRRQACTRDRQWSEKASAAMTSCIRARRPITRMQSNHSTATCRQVRSSTREPRKLQTSP